jgi:hypothetical protein
MSPIMVFAIKAEVVDPRARTFAFTAHKTMYGGKLIAEGDAVFVFASENEGGQGLIARGVVTHAEAIARKRGVARQTPRVSVTIRPRSSANASKCADGRRFPTAHSVQRTCAFHPQRPTIAAVRQLMIAGKSS